MRFSIIICTHNRAEVLPRALEAVGRLEVPAGGVELIVVDNASTDRTPEIVRAFAGRAPFEVRYVRESRLGHSVALNAGIAAARGELVAFTDDDALPCADWLRQLEQAFETHQADIVIGKARPLWDKGEPRWFSPQLNAQFALMDYGDEPFVLTDLQTALYGVNHANRREALARLGGFREDLGLFGIKGGPGNDTDLQERAFAAGMRIAYQPAAVVRHIIPESRCQKGYHRKVCFSGGQYTYHVIKAKRRPVPWLFGVPRYLHRLALSDLGRYLAALVRLRTADAFYHELRLVRYFGVWSYSWRAPRQDRPALPVAAERPVATSAR